LDQQLAQKLLSSIKQRKLVIFCGAGLSMSAPSSLPSAQTVTDRCIEAYEQSALEPPMPNDNRNDLGMLAEYFFTRNLQSFFINQLVEWEQFTGLHNDGHTALADFLTCKAMPFVITSNYDLLVERAAEMLGERAFVPCLDGDCANIERKHSPLLKIHGSMLERDATLWCREQLKKSNPDPVNQRLRGRWDASRNWLSGRLVEMDLVFVGFWSDWTHLSKLLMFAIRSMNVPFVLLVDPAPEEALKAKAPALWRWAKRKNIQFQHLPERGAEFLAELRRLYSVNFLESATRSARAAFQAQTGAEHAPTIPFAGLDNVDLYSLRRDFCGVPPGQIPRDPEPTLAMASTAKAHLLLRHAGSTMEGPCHLTANGRRVRVVNGLTRILSQVKAEFVPRLPPEPKLDYVICAGAEDDGGAQPNIVRPSDNPTIVRFGDTAKWITVGQAHAEGIF
jgi:NAD-dependent SIR2 family protein deacetylase